MCLKKHLNLATQGYYIQTLDDSGRIWLTLADSGVTALVPVIVIMKTVV